jgi:SAM-dependent methyltransferase
VATRFDRLLAEAESTPFVGFDFSWLEGRVEEVGTSWDYLALVRERTAYPLLDIGTGGGEVFSRLAPFEGLTVATESWPPNVHFANERLSSLGAQVVQTEAAPNNSEWRGTGGDLPFCDEAFGLIVNRHTSFSPTEVARVLRGGSSFITQQVGELDNAELREAFGSPPIPVRWGLDGWINHLKRVGFEVIDAREEVPSKIFKDIGALAWYMKAIPWEFPGFSVATHREFLAALDRRMPLLVHDHRYYLEARRLLSSSTT